MKKRLGFNPQFALLLALSVGMGVAHGNTITVTNPAATGPGSLTSAISALNHGDTIAFNLPGAGVHYIQTPPNGYPLITKNNITFDGYTQSGASPNTASIHAANNAVLQICLTSTNGNALSMQTACATSFGAAIPRLGYGNDEQAVLGFFHATNATIKGLAILAAPLTSTAQYANGTCKAICFAANSAENGGGQCENWRVSGCWFGVEPTTRQVAYMPDGITVATPTVAITSYRTRNAVAPDNTVYNTPGTIGVAVGSATPREEFNVFVTGWGFDAEGLGYRFSGNFWNVLPDGMTAADMSTLRGGLQLGDGFIEVGRNASNLTIGTDGDGVNDAEEGNVFAGFGAPGSKGVVVNLYSDPQTNFIFAGNYLGVAVDGVTKFRNACALVNTFGASSSGRIGSDFDGVSDALEANVICNNNPFALQYPAPVGSLERQLLLFNAGARLSFRGNKTINNDLIPFDYADGAFGRRAAFTNYSAPYLNTTSPNGLMPALASTNLYPALSGTFAPGLAPYTNIAIDVYQLDPEGWNNGEQFRLQELTDHATFTNGFPQGSKFLGSFSVPNTGTFSIDLAGLDLGSGAVTVTANYSADPAGTKNGRTHTSNFSNPAILAIMNTLPQIATQPQSIMVVVGATANFQVTASGTLPLSFQWRKGGAPVSGAASPAYAILNVQPSDAGNFDVVVSNASGSVTSLVAVLTVDLLPHITSQPQSITVPLGSNTIFQVTATGLPPLSYQWRMDGAPLPGATANSYTIADVEPAMAGSYSVVVSNASGSVTSAPALLNFSVPPPVLASLLSATADTPPFSNSSPATAIDGIAYGNGGWAGSSNGGPATLVFQTATNIGFSNGTMLTFTLYQGTSSDADPNFQLGCFRLSATTDDRSTYADGLYVGGRVVANWTVLEPLSYTAANLATLTKLSDLSLLASGGSDTVDTIYTVTAYTALTNITGFRLEALINASLPNNGPGRSTTGAFQLQEIQVGVQPAWTNPHPQVQVTWGLALANPVQSAAPGDTLSFAGTLNNGQGRPLAIRSVGLFFDTIPATTNWRLDFDASFLQSATVIPAGGYVGPIFQVTLAADLPANFFAGGALEVMIEPQQPFGEVTPADGHPMVIEVPFTINGPPLDLERAAEGLVLSWPASAQDYILQSSTNLTLQKSWESFIPALWRDYNRLSTKIPIEGEIRFFRLRLP